MANNLIPMLRVIGGCCCGGSTAASCVVSVRFVIILVTRVEYYDMFDIISYHPVSLLLPIING